MHPRLKKIIFNKLYEDLKHVEIIHFENSIWFIDREKEYWYLEYHKSGYLWWRFDFFTDFFRLFSMERSEYERVIADWVEEVLNSKVDTTMLGKYTEAREVEEVLNFKVDTTEPIPVMFKSEVEEVLSSRVNTILPMFTLIDRQVEEVLDPRVNTIRFGRQITMNNVEEVLNSTL